MRCKLLLFLLLFSFTLPTEAAQEDNVLFVFSESSPSTELIYATISAFQPKVERVHIKDLANVRVAAYDQVIVYGDGIVPMEQLNSYTGKMIVIGQAITQIEGFEVFQVNGNRTIQQIDTYILEESMLVNNSAYTGDALLYGTSLEGQVPLVVQNGNKSWINLQQMNDVTLYYVSTYLPKLLEVQLPDIHDAMLLIEDVTPETDAALLKEVAAYIQTRSIPLYIHVTPIYINQTTNDIIYLADQDELLKVLQQAVNNGAYIVVGNYRQMLSENGVELSDFWNTVTDERLYTDEQEEAAAIQGQLIRSIQALTKLGLAPAAISIPNEKTSLNGYKVTTYHFNMHIGRIQQISPLFITKPEILYGGTLFPNTLGAFNEENKVAFERAFTQLTSIRGTVLSAKYSMFNEMNGLPELVDLFMSVENKRWIELKTYAYEVQTEKVFIQYENGRQIVNSDLTIIDDWRLMIEEKPIEFVLWVIVSITACFVLLFMIYISYMRLHYRTRLFEERDE